MWVAAESLMCPSLIDFTDTRGFDVTGVVTEVDLTFPEVKTQCDCIQECLKRPTTCANYVYKFSTAASVKSGYRTCTLYSDFNLPSGVVLEFNLQSKNNMNINAAEIKQLNNNPHAGALVPQAFKDINLDTVPDNQAVSGCVPCSQSYYHSSNQLFSPVWQLANGQVLC